MDDKDEIKLKIRNRLYNVLKITGLNQKEFAEAIGMNEAAFCQVLSCKRDMPQKYIYTISKKYNMSINWLMGENVPQYEPQESLGKILADIATDPQLSKAVQQLSLLSDTDKITVCALINSLSTK